MHFNIDMNIIALLTSAHCIYFKIKNVFYLPTYPHYYANHLIQFEHINKSNSTLCLGSPPKHQLP